jgi:hypothetical protein
MTRKTQIAGGGALGFLAVSSALLMFSGQTLTPVTWACGSCPVGPATVSVYAFDPTSIAPAVSKDVPVTFPLEGDVFAVELDLYATTYNVSGVVKYADGQQWQIEAKTVMGLGDPVPTEPIPTPTSTVAPTPTVTPDPLPVPADCSPVDRGADAAGNQWSLVVGAGHVWLVTPDGVSDYAFPGGGSLPGAVADHFIFAGGVAYGHDPRDGQYYKLTGRNLATREAPICSSPTPTPTGTPTSTPTVTPTPTPEPTPTPTPTPVVAAPVMTLKTCAVSLTAQKPAAATGSSWKVQYFEGATALTSSSYTVTRSVTLQARAYSVTARWTKSGMPTYTSPAVTIGCQPR